MKPASLLTVMVLMGAFCLSGCQHERQKASGSADDYLVSFADSLTGQHGYKNREGDVVIPLGKYSLCFTDTFRTYAIVLAPKKGLVAIDRKEAVLYEVFPFDNGPDYPSEGLFRIQQNHKIGFADSATGSIVIAPQFGCAWPFEKGKAQVSLQCETVSDGEHSTWKSNQWFYIDKQGHRLQGIGPGNESGAK